MGRIGSDRADANTPSRSPSALRVYSDTRSPRVPTERTAVRRTTAVAIAVADAH